MAKTQHYGGRGGYGHDGNLPPPPAGGRQRYWSGPTNKRGNPIIRGVDANSSAAIMGAWRAGTTPEKFVVQKRQELQDQAQADQITKAAKMGAFAASEQRNANAAAGLKTDDSAIAPVVVDPSVARMKNLIAGGMQPNQAKDIVAREFPQAAPAPTLPGVAPQPTAPVTQPAAMSGQNPVAAPAGPNLPTVAQAPGLNKDRMAALMAANQPPAPAAPVVSAPPPSPTIGAVGAGAGFGIGRANVAGAPPAPMAAAMPTTAAAIPALTPGTPEFENSKRIAGKNAAYAVSAQPAENQSGTAFGDVKSNYSAADGSGPVAQPQASPRGRPYDNPTPPMVQADEDALKKKMRGIGSSVAVAP